MDRKENNKKITAIVPAYNEAVRIKHVLDVLTTYPGFSDIIIIDDGSTDNTEDVVKKYPVNYIKNSSNQGKGYAMDIGVNNAKSDVILFVDADVSGLTHKIIGDLVRPVIAGEVDMFIGMRNRKLYYLHNIIIIIPLLGGERAVTKKLWQSLPSYYKHRFRVEAGLNFYAEYYGKGFQYKVIKDLKQVVKEKKYGLVQGLKQRFGMTLNIVSAQLKLQFVDIPESAKNSQLLGLISLQSFLGMALGGIILAAAYFGPNNFILKIFAEELIEDPRAPFVHFLLYLTNVTAVSTFVVFGGFIFTTNLLTFILTFRKLGHLFSVISSKIKNKKLKNQ